MDSLNGAAGSKLLGMTASTNVKIQIPTELVPLFERLAAIYGEEEQQRIQATLLAPKRVAWLKNPLRPADCLPPGEPVAGLEGCFVVPADDRDMLMTHPAVETGSAYPTNPSSIAAARVLTVRPEQEVLDLAAAPGGKTLQLAAAMGNRGRIAAVEAVKGRFHRMRANLTRCGVTIADFYMADGRTIGRKVPERFDRVLLDSPCSSESRIRLDEPVSFRHWSTRKTKEMVRKQRGLIRSAYLALKPGGELVYCTCAFSVEENELVLDYLLRREPGAELLELDLPAAGIARSLPGLTAWQGKTLDARLSACRRILPDDLFDGFFVARIRKNG
jgi:16S rRNA (cytosine1407-C5)-methyltransferase